MKGQEIERKQKTESSQPLIKAFHDECTGDIQAAGESLTCDFVKQELEEIKKARDEMEGDDGSGVGYGEVIGGRADTLRRTIDPQRIIGSTLGHVNRWMASESPEILTVAGI